MKNGSIAGVIHDYDGHMVNSNPVRDDFFRYLCHKYSKQSPEEKIIGFRGRGLGMEVYRIMGFDLKKDEHMIWEEFIHYFNLDPAPLFQGMRETLHAVKLKEKKQAIATLNSGRIIGPFLKRERLAGLFDLVGTKEHGSSKTELLKLIATELHIKPSRCIYAGDEIQDIKAAVETGMIPIVTGYGGFYSPELLRAAMKEYSIPESRLVLKPENLGVVIARLLDKAN